jgi:hypothetical protein
VSWSGHYVRDPFTLRALEAERLLRQQSQPWARFFRDFGLVKRLAVLAAAGSTFALGVVLATSGGGFSKNSLLQHLWKPGAEQATPAAPQK